MPAVFGIKFEFSRDPMAFIVKYHVTSGVLVIIGGISFLIDPKIVPGRMGLLVTLFLVLANFFSNAQVHILVPNYISSDYKFFVSFWSYLCMCETVYQ